MNDTRSRGGWPLTLLIFTTIVAAYIGPAGAESSASSGAAPVSAAAGVHFRIVIPPLITVGTTAPGDTGGFVNSNSGPLSVTYRPAGARDHVLMGKSVTQALPTPGIARAGFTAAVP